MPQLIDAFSIALVLFVTAIGYIDWVQGTPKREKTKRKIGEWSVRFVDAPPSLVQKWAVQISHLCLRQATFGRSGVSFWKTFSLSIGIAILFAYLATNNSPLTPLKGATSVLSKGRGPFSLLLVSLPLHFGYIVSVLSTIYVLKKIRRASLAKSSAYLIIDVLVAYSIVAVMLLGLMLYSAYYEGMKFFGPDIQAATKNFIRIIIFGPLLLVASILGLYSNVQLPASFAALLVPVAPSLVHPIVLLLLCFIRLTLSWWRRHVADFLYALYESKQGVLTLLAIGIAALGKLLQYILSALFI